MPFELGVVCVPAVGGGAPGSSDKLLSMKGIQKLLPSLLCMGVASGRPAPGVVPDAGLAGGAGIHLDTMSTMDVKGMEA